MAIKNLSDLNREDELINTHDFDREESEQSGQGKTGLLRKFCEDLLVNTDFTIDEEYKLI